MIRLALILMFVPMMATAQAVTIRSGEHDNFTRLVLSIGSGTQWELDQSGSSIVLRLEGATNGFDISEVFSRIPRSRISDLVQTAPDTLQVSLDCTCDHDAFLWRPGELVVDVIDSETGSMTTPMARPVRTPLRLPQADSAANSTVTNTTSVLPSMLLLDRPAPFNMPPGPEQADPLANEIDISVTENALAEGIARAASQGFLDPTVPQLEPEEMQHDGLQTDTTIESVPEPIDSPRRPGIGIATAMDRDLARVGAVIERSVDQPCLPGDLFQIDEWGDDAPFHAQVSALAEALAGEFGEEPLLAQETLARLYIHFGFGAEARLALAADTASSRSRLVLSELAGIIDDYEGTYPLISAQEGCSTPAALWAFLINPKRQDEEARNHLVQQFFALPDALRGHISPRLAREFVDIGEPDAAERLLHSAESTDAGATHEVAAARAFVAEQMDDPESALDVLSREASDNARTSPESLIRLIELQLEQGLDPTEADLLLVASLRKEHDGTPVEHLLENTEAKGRVAIGQFQSALDLVEGREDFAAISITNDAYLAIARDASAGNFLGFAYSEIPESLTPETENVLAARLIELGFPDRASILLEGAATREAAADRRYLRAEAALGAGDYASVIGSLLGIDDDRARALRARAHEGLGEYGAALAALRPDQSASSPALQFRANAWERLTVEDDEVLSSFAQVVLDPAGNDAAETLADRRAILAQSQESRRAVEGLLLRFDGTTPQE